MPRITAQPRTGSPGSDRPGRHRRVRYARLPPRDHAATSSASSGLSIGAIYTYFGSKDELFLACCDFTTESVAGAIAARLTEGNTTAERLDIAVGFYLRHARRHGRDEGRSRGPHPRLGRGGARAGGPRDARPAPRADHDDRPDAPRRGDRPRRSPGVGRHRCPRRRLRRDARRTLARPARSRRTLQARRRGTAGRRAHRAPPRGGEHAAARARRPSPRRMLRRRGSAERSGGGSGARPDGPRPGRAGDDRVHAPPRAHGDRPVARPRSAGTTGSSPPTTPVIDAGARGCFGPPAGRASSTSP